MSYWHLRFSSVTRVVLFPGEAGRRLAVRCIVRIAGPYLLLFCVVDDHVHVLIAGVAERLGAIRSALSRALAPIASAAFAPSFVVPVRSRAHLVRNVDYFLAQSAHHGIEGHPATDSGSCFQDLVGARRIDGFDPGLLKRALPRLRRDDLLRAVSLPARALDPMPLEAIRGLGAASLVEACASVLGVGPVLAGRDGPVVEARRLAANLGAEAGIARADLAWALPASPRAVRRLATEPANPRFLHAARVRLALERTARGVGRAA